MSLAPWQRRIYDAAMQSHALGRLGHALLLSGPPAMGKHEVAEAIAKRLLCSTPGSDGFACGSCRSCHLFPAQRVGLLVTQAHPDLQRVGLEPNEKGDKLRTEISIDQIRKLGQWFSLTPQLGGAQVAVIEPADLMNTASGNALLKTLEEPASNRFLLLVTSRPGRLPATIRSRCQRLEFRLPAQEEALQALASEGLNGPEALAALAAARGNPGLAAAWTRDGALQLRGEVIDNLNAVGSGKTGPVEMAQRWLGDENAELRLRFAAELALEAAAMPFQRPMPGRSILTAPGDFSIISNWFDSINRTREQLRAPLRNDLVLAGLLREWRNMFETGR